MTTKMSIGRILAIVACLVPLISHQQASPPPPDKKPVTIEGRRLLGFNAAWDHVRHRLKLENSQTKLENYRIIFSDHEGNYAYSFLPRIDPDDNESVTDKFVSRYGISITLLVSPQTLKVEGVITE